MASVDLHEKANFTRLSRLLVDKGTEALRNTFDAIHPPASLPAVLAANRTSLLKLKPRVINDSQWDLLYPPSGNPPDSKTFDVTLLTVLFRNICGLPKTGWGAMPVDTDRSMQANILRIKSYRNKVYAHVTSTQVDNAIFESLWQKVTQALVELNIPQKDVDHLKTCPIGPEEEIYVENLKDWKSQEEECLKVLEDLNDEVKSIEYSLNRLAPIIEESRDGIKQLCQSALRRQNVKEQTESSITQPSQASKENNNVEKNCNKGYDEDLLRKLAKHNFKGKIRRKVEFFLPGTREWLLKKVDDWFIGNEGESRILLLTAGPGFGKSVFAAKVCEDFKKKEKLAASYFCDFSDSNLRNPMMMLQSLASQMCENVVGFKEKLLDQLKRPHEVRSLKDSFGIYLRNPLDELEVDEPTLVVIDGLDECAADDKNEIVNLIADYFPDLPKFIKVLVTSRPEISVAKLNSLSKVNIASNDANNNSDLEIYLKSCIPSIPDKEAGKNVSPFLLVTNCNLGVFETLVRKCEGSFLYAFYTQSELRKRGDLDKITFEEIVKFLPKSLDSVYETYFQRLEVELKAIVNENLDVLKVLEMIVASEGPLPLRFIAQVLGLDPNCRQTRKVINKVNETVSCLLYVSDDMVTVFHKSVVDWLLARGYQDHEYTVKDIDGDKSLWIMCEQIFEKVKNAICSGHDLNLTNDVKYALQYGLKHLVACDMKDRFFWLVDVVLLHVLLTVCPAVVEIEFIWDLWNDILRVDTVISDELRARISWHIVEVEPFVKGTLVTLDCKHLQNVLTHSPKGYFSDNEKKIAESLLSAYKLQRFVDINCNHEVEVIPLAVSSPTSSVLIRAIGLSFDKTMAAIAQDNGSIILVGLPRLVELWQYSTEFKSISCCTFAPDDSFVLFGKLETALNIAERKEVPFFHRNKRTFVSCAFSPNGKKLVTSNGGSTIQLWDVARQSLLSLLSAEVPINWCRFSCTGLFIIGDKNSDEENCVIEDGESDRDDYLVEDSESDAEDSFCVWNVITLQRCDLRTLPGRKREKGKTFQSKLCKRCFPPAFEILPTSKRLDLQGLKAMEFRKMEYQTWSTGIYNGAECIFALDEQSLVVIENTHFTTVAAWKFSVNVHSLSSYKKITKIEDDMWLYAEEEKLVVFRTVVPKCPTRVLWSSFSPDGSHLSTCTSDGCINIWNVETRQVDHRFKCNQGESPFACYWSKEFLFVLFSFCDKNSSLSKYPVNVNLKVLFSQSQQMLLGHLVDEFVHLSTVVHFSEGFLIFKCCGTVKVLNVNGVGGPRMIVLPGIEAGMRVAVSPCSSFIFGGGMDNYYIWKRNNEEAGVYDGFLTYAGPLRAVFKECTCCFSNDSKVAVVLCERATLCLDLSGFVIDLETGNYKILSFDMVFLFLNLFCINNYRVVICACYQSVDIFDMDTGALLESSFQRYLTRDFVMQTKLSPDATTLAFPMINGDIEFLRLCIPQTALLRSIKRKAAIEWSEKWKSGEQLLFWCAQFRFMSLLQTNLSSNTNN